MKIILILLILLTGCNNSSVSVQEINPLDTYLNLQSNELSELRDNYLQLVNNHRHDVGESSLIYSEVIEAQAQAHVEKMAKGEVAFSHTDSDARCAAISSDLVTGNLCGEIIAKGYNSAETVFSSWVGSATQKAHLENARYTHTGLGITRSSTGVIYWTQIFLEVE